MKRAEKLFNRKELADHWNCSTRKIDRLRKDGLLSWIDLTGGRGKRPVVRFKESHIEEFEKRHLMDINQENGGNRYETLS